MLELTAERTPMVGSTGIVGERQLVCVQTFDIARLTTDPVVLIPGTFVAIGGRGPLGDSNESGKTSFLAATGLLLGDPEWRMTGGGPSATTGLLFEPETAGVAAHTYPPARQGYIIGVFADPAAHEGMALTVWCRINATAPYFQVRYADGEHLVTGDSNRERYDAVDALWEAMPSVTQLGAHHYAEKLYGDSPRCLAYVSRRGKQHSEPSLLQMNAGGFTPERIGEDLIRLTGRAAAFETEARQRQRLDEARSILATKQRQDERARHEEEAQLTGVLSRNAARAHLSEAQHIWSLHFARGYLDVLEREEELTVQREQASERLAVHEAAVAEAQADLDSMSVPAELQGQHDEAEREALSLGGQMDRARQAEVEARVRLDAVNEAARRLDEVADGWTSPSGEGVSAALSTARDASAHAQQHLGAAKTMHSEAEAYLQSVQAGTAGRAGHTTRMLRSLGIGAAPLRDVELSDLARAEWEPRLALYEAAVVVEPRRMNEALAAAAEEPGTVLIAGEDGPLPDGVLGAPDGAAGFLARLAQAAPVADGPNRAEQPLGVVVIGGFAEPQTGHAARVARARQALIQAQTRLDEAAKAVRVATLDIERLEGDLLRARAAQELIGTHEIQRSAREEAGVAQQAVNELVGPLKKAQARHLDLAARLQGYELALKGARDRVEARKEKHARAVDERRSIQRNLDSLQVAYWRTNWGATPADARDALAEERRSEKRLRNRAAELLQDALSALSIQSDGGGAPTEQLAEVARRRSLMQEDPERGRVPATLEEVGRPLRDFLDSHHDTDQVIEERVTRAREQRAAELEVAIEEAQRLGSALATLQDGVEQRIRQALESIGDEYDRLNRESGWYGADLHIEARRPEGPTDRWRWSVTPRWKRSINGRLLPYSNQANTAQEKLATVQLVLAALLAAPSPCGRVLVLDELGDSLGVSHRREVLKEIAETAQAKGVTVLGTCQDSVMTDAAHHCGEIVYFEYPSHEEALNRPTRMFGFDEIRARIELTGAALRSGRPFV